MEGIYQLIIRKRFFCRTALSIETIPVIIPENSVTGAILVSKLNSLLNDRYFHAVENIKSLLTNETADSKNKELPASFQEM